MRKADAGVNPYPSIHRGGAHPTSQIPHPARYSFCCAFMYPQMAMREASLSFLFGSMVIRWAQPTPFDAPSFHRAYLAGRKGGLNGAQEKNNAK